MNLSELSPEDKRKLLNELEAEQKTAAEQKAQERKSYKEIAGNTVDSIFPELENLSSFLSKVKKAAFDSFHTVIEMKNELYQVKLEQRSHSFSNNTGDKRVTVGYRTLDRYDDTAEAGIEKIKSYIESLVTEANKKTITIINSLLKKDDKGNLKASRVLELQKIAKDINEPLFTDGVEIIANAYKPDRSANFVSAEYKDENNNWITVPLSISSAEFAKQT